MVLVFMSNKDHQTGANYLPVINVLWVISNSTIWQCRFSLHPNHLEKWHGMPFRGSGFSWLPIFIVVLWSSTATVISFSKWNLLDLLKYHLKVASLHLFFPHLGLVSFPFKPYPISTALQTFSFYTSVTTILAVLALQSLLNGQFILWFFSHQLEYRFFFSTSLE